MALTDAEIWRCKAELGFNLLETGAEPYIGTTAVFNQVIQLYMSAGAATTSSTAVTAATTPTPVTLSLASGTGFSAFDRVAIDVDERQEIPTVQSVSGNNIVVLLMKAHTGTYPVTVEAGESIVREILTKIRAVKSRMSTTFGTGSLKKVDELEWYQSGTQTQFGNLGSEIDYWRNELSAALGVPSMWSVRRAAGATLSVY